MPPVVPPGSTPALSVREMEIFTRWLQGWPRWRIAHDLGYSTENQIDCVLKSPAVQAAMEQARRRVIDNASDIIERLQALAPDALGTIERVMLSATRDRDKLSAAMDLLDRAGFKPTDRVEHVNGNRTAAFDYDALSTEDKVSLREIAKRAARATAGLAPSPDTSRLSPGASPDKPSDLAPGSPSPDKPLSSKKGVPDGTTYEPI